MTWRLLKWVSLKDHKVETSTEKRSMNNPSKFLMLPANSLCDQEGIALSLPKSGPPTAFRTEPDKGTHRPSPYHWPAPGKPLRSLRLQEGRSTCGSRATPSGHLENGMLRPSGWTGEREAAPPCLPKRLCQICVPHPPDSTLRRQVLGGAARSPSPSQGHLTAHTKI